MDGTVKVQETYLKNRTGFAHPMPSFNISIAINNTQEMDSGEYMCTVNILDEDAINGKNIGLINLTVLGKFWVLALSLPAPDVPFWGCGG